MGILIGVTEQLKQSAKLRDENKLSMAQNDARSTNLVDQNT